MATVKLTRKHAIPWDMGSAGKTCINYAGFLLWNANLIQKLGPARIKPHGRASVKRKKFLNPVQQHKAGFDRGKRTSLVCSWQGKIWWVPAERTRAATSHAVISRALKLFLVSSLKSIHVTALQIFTSGRYSSMQLVHDTSPRDRSLFIRLWEGSEDFSRVTVKFAWSPIRLYNILLISPH